MVVPFEEQQSNILLDELVVEGSDARLLTAMWNNDELAFCREKVRLMRLEPESSYKTASIQLLCAARWDPDRVRLLLSVDYHVDPSALVDAVREASVQPQLQLHDCLCLLLKRAYVRNVSSIFACNESLLVVRLFWNAMCAVRSTDGWDASSMALTCLSPWLFDLVHYTTHHDTNRHCTTIHDTTDSVLHDRHHTASALPNSDLHRPWKRA